jgi:hypothetical protein
LRDSDSLAEGLKKLIDWRIAMGVDTAPVVAK